MKAGLALGRLLVDPEVAELSFGNKANSWPLSDGRWAGFTFYCLGKCVMAGKVVMRMSSECCSVAKIKTHATPWKWGLLKSSEYVPTAFKKIKNY